MEQSAVTTDFGDNFEDNLPPLLSSMFEGLKRDGIYLSQGPAQEKSAHPFEDEAIEAVNEAARQAFLLFRGNHDVAQAARILEKIQVAATTAEKAAFIAKTERTRRCGQIVQKITDQCRQYFHDLKAASRGTALATARR